MVVPAGPRPRRPHAPELDRGRRVERNISSVARFIRGETTHRTTVADEEEPTPLDQEQVISLIGRHTKQLAELARDQGCTTLYYLLHAAAEQAEKELSGAAWQRREWRPVGPDGFDTPLARGQLRDVEQAHHTASSVQMRRPRRWEQSSRG